MAKHRASVTGRTTLFFLTGNSECAGLDTGLLGMGKVHNRETASAGTSVTGVLSPIPLCLTGSVMF